MDLTTEHDSTDSEHELDTLVEEKFEVSDAGQGKTKFQNKVNPERQCLHCNWIQKGSRHVFVNHVLGETKGLRIQICNAVPNDVKENFRKAISLGQSHEVELGDCDQHLDIPVISDEILSQFSDFSTEIWRRDTFIRKFGEHNSKSLVSSVTTMAYQGMYRTFYSEHHARWIEMKRQKSIPAELEAHTAEVQTPKPLLLINDILKHVEPAALIGPGRPVVAVKVRNLKFPCSRSPTHLAWCATLPWLKFDGRAMFCTLCVSRLASCRISESNNFISGTTNFQHDNLKLHVTKYH
jgi:hypothetical protein